MLTFAPSTLASPTPTRSLQTEAPPTRRILAIASNLSQASCRLRVAALKEPLASRGFDLDIQCCPRDWNARRLLLRSAADYHAVLLHRKLLDPWNWKVLRRHARRIVFDVDDAVRYHATRVGPYSLLRTALRFAATARNVDGVVAGNAYLADLFGPKIGERTIIPTAIDAERYQLKHHVATTSTRLVWIGSRSTLPYLKQCFGTLETAARSTPGLRLVTICDATVESKHIPIQHIPWSLANEPRALCEGDIGIAPTPLDRWTLGKCGFKILQYMAAGLPVIASPVGANAELVRHGVTGLLATRPQEWFDAIATLAHDVDRRTRMGQAGRVLAERHFRIDDVADAWAELLAK